MSDDEIKKLRMTRIHDLNQIGGLQEEVAFLKGLLERLDDAVYFHNCKPDSAKCSKRIDAIIVEFQKRYHDDNG